MNKTEFTKIMKEINIAYGDKKFPLSKEVLDVWYKYLGDYGYCDVLSSVEQHVRVSVFPPAVSEILKYVNEIKDGVSRKSADERELYLSIVASYPSAIDSVDVREVYKKIVSDDLKKAVSVLNKVKDTVTNWERAGIEDIPSLCEFLKGLEL